MTQVFARTAIAAVAAATLASPSFAATEFEFDFVFDRAAIETNEGAEVAYEALKSDVADHCTSGSSPSRIINRLEQQRCTMRTLDGAVDEIDSAALDAVHARVTG